MSGRYKYFAVLLLCLSLPFFFAGGAGFTDVAPESWYGEAVEQMAEKGLLLGYPDGSFGPEDPITAAQFVTVAARCAGAELPSSSNRHWAAGAMEVGLQSEWYDWDELPPTGERFDQPISRQLAVKVLMKALLPTIEYDHHVESQKISDFSTLDGRYYEPVLSAYAAGVVTGDGEGNFRPLDGLTRAEACMLFLRAMDIADTSGTGPQPSPEPSPVPAAAAAGGVTENGWLQVKGTQLCNEAGDPVVLRGMSTHGLQWYGQYANLRSIQNTAENGANVFRVAMYTDAGGYFSQPETIKEKAFAAVDAAIGQDIYVLLDWHILTDGDPMAHVAEAEAFFAEAAERYKDAPNVLYEICNEPNGNVTWAENVKPYAERILPVIRVRSPKSVVLVGSSTWSQDVHLAAADPLEGENLMYTFHFYAGTHGQGFRDRVDKALAAGLPIFISEWGVSRADGSGGVFLAESGEWLDFLEERNISWCNWSLCDKNETSAALRPGTSPDSTWTEGDLTESGKFVFSRLKGS